MVTTNFNFHSPEIEYLKNNQNGIITKNNLTDYANCVINLLKDNTLLDNHKAGCIVSSNYYTTERMVQNFSDGIIKALNSN